MDTLNIIEAFTIREIIIVTFDKSVIELYFNISKVTKNISLKLGLNNDGETISFEVLDDWILTENIKYEIYSVKHIKMGENINTDFYELLDEKIIKLMLGINDDVDKERKDIYYFLLITDRNKFLYYNNGDEGKYSFTRIDEITKSDIYNYEWISYSLSNW